MARPGGSAAPPPKCSPNAGTTSCRCHAHREVDVITGDGLAAAREADLLGGDKVGFADRRGVGGTVGDDPALGEIPALDVAVAKGRCSRVGQVPIGPLADGMVRSIRGLPWSGGKEAMANGRRARSGVSGCGTARRRCSGDQGRRPFLHDLRGGWNKQQPPKSPMSIDQARAMIGKLVTAWLDSF